jgi:hypothetical protein
MEQAGITKSVRMAGKLKTSNKKIRNRRIWHVYYITSVIYMTVMVIIGFWPSYFGQLFGDFPARNWIIHLHAAIFTGWLLLLMVQVSLVAAGNTKFHRKLGIAGGAYGVLILALGIGAAFVLPVENIESGVWSIDEAASFLILPLGDMLIFSGFFGAALYYRRRSEIHKRLMLAASVMLVFPAVARMFGGENIPGLILFWLLPILAGVIMDGLIHRKVHPAFLVGLGVLLLSIGRVAVWETEAWLHFARALLGLFL